MPGGIVQSEQWIAVVAIVFGSIMVTVVTGMVVNAWRKVSETRQREESRREVAAYVAEGSITPVEAERILRAGGPKTIRESISDVLERHGISV